MPSRERRNPLPIAISFAIHAGAFIALLGTPGVRLPHAAESEYKQKIQGKEQKLVWYKFRKELPAVSPSAAKTDIRKPRAEKLAKQRIVSAAKDVPERDRMVWTPAPELAPAPPLEMPNVLAVRLPDFPNVPPKEFIAPPEPPHPELAKVDLPDAPPLAARNFVKVPELGSPLPPKVFTRPQPLVPALRKPEIAAEAPPSLPVGGGAPVAGFSPRLPPRPFTAPPAGRTAPSTRNLSLDAPDNLNVAVVGLKPADMSAVLPALPSPGRFSAGPHLNPNGSVVESNPTALTVPGLFVGGARAPAKPDLLAQVVTAPTSAENIRAAIRRGEPVMVTRVSPAPTSTSAAPPGTAKVSSAPDPRFDGRDIYLMAIQLPNITSNSGSWLMWYSDRTMRETGRGSVSPPVPRRKVDPKYIASAVAERIEGRVQLACVIDRDGRVSLIELVRGIDERLDDSAKQALAKWEFSPATRNGIPVDVDVLVEIPFRLAPPPPHR